MTTPYEPETIAGRTCDGMRKLLSAFFKEAPYGEQRKLWNILTALRGPDGSPTWLARKVRKAQTTAIVRYAAFYGAAGGSAKIRAGSVVVLPPKEEWDHFDQHVAKAAVALGLEIRSEKLAGQEPINKVYCETTSET